MLSVIIPAHNEEAMLGRCLSSVIEASQHPGIAGERVIIVLVADQCSDETVSIASKFPVVVVCIDDGNVGRARSVGASVALAGGARWLAFTDADSVVGCDWLVQQLACRADVVCGTVEVVEWPSESEAARLRFAESYSNSEDHRHVHGANLGVSAKAYVNAGGFQHLSAHEDVHLVAALKTSGAKICWTCKPRVSTSPRLNSRTGAGFGATLNKWNEAVRGAVISTSGNAFRAVSNS